jgi:hypothetical protein
MEKRTKNMKIIMKDGQYWTGKDWSDDNKKVAKYPNKREADRNNTDGGSIIDVIVVL